MGKSNWRVFDLAELVETCEQRGTPYLEFLRVPALSSGIYRLVAGEEDPQTAHDEDEVYFVLRGRAQLIMDGEKRDLGPGSILYIPADMDHRFVNIEEDLSLLVFFGSGGPSGAEV
jgi:mannose-6-phosphate isomerase-like protein (cupin superfamily)